MVSLRRKKFKVMAEGRKRKSARLLALEELKNEKAVLALPVNIQQTKGDRQIDLRKQGKKKVKEVYLEAQISQEASANINGNSLNSPLASRKPTDRIIGYILDMLEVKDTHELFSMPDNLQTYDYEESMSKPGDFATLRQKHTDGMYTTLEHFENDVLTVFRKAIESNTQDSITFREAMSMRDQAKQIFQSLKNNLTYAELELSTWHQKYFNYKKRAVRNDGIVGTLGHAAHPECSSHPSVSIDMKRTGDAIGVAASGRSHSTSFRRNPQSKASSKPQGRRAAPIECEHPKSPEEQRRYTYKPRTDSNESLFTMVCSEPVPLVYNKNTLSYQESLRRYVKDAGPAAKLAAEKKYLEYAQRVQAQSMPPLWRPPPFGSSSSQSNLSGQPLYFPSILGQNFGGSNLPASTNYGPSSPSLSTKHCSSGADGVQDADKFEHRACQLHTDELLTLFSLIGTPEFLQRSLAPSPKQAPKRNQGFSSFQGIGATRIGVSSMTQTGECSNSKLELPKSQPANELLIWQPRLSGSKSWEQRGLASPTPNPRLAPEAASSSVNAGFYDRSSCSFPSKPTV